MRVLSSLKASPLGVSHSASRCLDLFGLVAGVAHDDEIVGVPAPAPGSPRRRVAASLRSVQVADPGGFLHPVQGDVRAASG